MNFFEHQEHARRQTRKLLFLFALAVISIVLVFNLLATVAWAMLGHGARLPNYFYPTNTLLVIAFVVGGSILETWRLRAGGDEVAQMVGARLLLRETADAYERRLLNIVEEMSIASGLAMPRVYLMDGELGINAFAAGYSPNEAVVAVSNGALRRLNRDELQGVVAHEFSHILNGDMRLNIRLIGVVYGLLLVASFGETLMSGMRHAPSDRQGGAGVLIGFVCGLVLWIVGYIGVFFGRLIKAAISRQREFLADASAVQFTRNPDGIGGALRKIGGLARELQLGSRIEHPKAEVLSHLFLGAARASLAEGLLATHPPLDERIRRIYNRAMPYAEAPLPEPTMWPEPEEEPLIPYERVTDFAAAREAYGSGLSDARAVVAPDAAINAVGKPQSTETKFARALANDAAHHPLIDGVRDPIGAQAAVLTLLIEHDLEVARRQRLIVGDGPLGARIDEFMPVVAQMRKTLRLPIVDLAIPTLKQLDAEARAEFLKLVGEFIRADGRVSLSEFVLQTIVARRLNADAARAVPVRYAEITALRGDVAVIASLVAHTCSEHAQGRTAAQRMEAASAQVAVSLPLLPAAAVRERGIEGSLDRLNQLAPLRKPLVIRAFVVAAIDGEGVLSLVGADLLRAVCAAIDAPMPPLVEAVYLDPR